MAQPMVSMVLDCEDSTHIPAGHLYELSYTDHQSGCGHDGNDCHQDLSQLFWRKSKLTRDFGLSAFVRSVWGGRRFAAGAVSGLWGLHQLHQLLPASVRRAIRSKTRVITVSAPAFTGPREGIHGAAFHSAADKDRRDGVDLFFLQGF